MSRGLQEGQFLPSNEGAPLCLGAPTTAVSYLALSWGLDLAVAPNGRQEAQDPKPSGHSPMTLVC